MSVGEPNPKLPDLSPPIRWCLRPHIMKGVYQPTRAAACKENTPK